MLAAPLRNSACRAREGGVPGTWRATSARRFAGSPQSPARLTRTCRPNSWMISHGQCTSRHVDRVALPDTLSGCASVQKSEILDVAGRGAQKVYGLAPALFHRDGSTSPAASGVFPACNLDFIFTTRRLCCVDRATSNARGARRNRFARSRTRQSRAPRSHDHDRYIIEPAQSRLCRRPAFFKHGVGSHFSTAPSSTLRFRLQFRSTTNRSDPSRHRRSSGECLPWRNRRNSEIRGR